MASLLGLTLNQRREDKVRERERVKGLQESICGGAMEKKIGFYGKLLHCLSVQKPWLHWDKLNRQVNTNKASVLTTTWCHTSWFTVFHVGLLPKLSLTGCAIKRNVVHVCNYLFNVMGWRFIACKGMLTVLLLETLRHIYNHITRCWLCQPTGDI